ncbi:MAG TPA: hypothetical protein VE010_13210, partial [Thermoanaerobaculia bacterium]|nr:hypothetical protein [Thermoanaerobaculia bacterium]
MNTKDLLQRILSVAVALLALMPPPVGAQEIPKAEPPPLEAGTDALPPIWQSGTYQYDGAGNIIAVGVAGAGSENDHGKANAYRYDTAGRLISATANHDSDNSQTYEYDAFGNLLKMTTTTAATTIVTSMSVDGQTNRLTSGTYDEAGNLTWDGANSSYSYDAMGQLTEKKVVGSVTEQYLYTASGERVAVRRVSPVGGADGWRWSLRDFSGKVLREYASSGTTGQLAWVEDYVYRGSVLAAAVRPDDQGGVRHFHLDHLGTPRLITGKNGYAFAYRDYL